LLAASKDVDARHKAGHDELFSFLKEPLMSANDAFHIAVLGGDGIGPEVMAPALEVLRKVESRSGLKFRFTDAPAGANHYRETGKSMPESTVRLCDEADAILLGACGLPSVRYPDNTEIMPQVSCAFTSTSMPACVRRG
jgi:3-isopropylmalate dehydrogenase